MKIIKEHTDYTDEEIMRIACEDWGHIMDGGVLAVWGKDILNLENREEWVGDTSLKNLEILA